MRKLPIIITLLSLAFSGVASAVEYVALTPQKRSIELNPTDIVQVVGWTQITEVTPPAFIEFDGYGRVSLKPAIFAGDVRYGLVQQASNPLIVTGSTRAKIPDGINISATLKITNASELNKVGPTSVLVLPENATGNYDLIVESSSDSVTWTPFHSQAVQSVTAKRLFRVRIVHKGQEEAAAKGEEK